MYPILLQIGHFELRAYGVIFLLAFLVAAWLGEKEAQRKGLGSGLVWDFIVWALVGGLIGARLYYVAFHPSYFLDNPWQIFAIWRGGIGVIGSLIGGFLAGMWYCRRRGIPVLKFADALTPGIALGQTLGQFACLANGDSFGKPTDLPWAIVYTDPRAMAPLNVPLHPLEIYEMAAYFAVFLIVWLIRKPLRTNGFVFLVYLAAYGVARFAMEFFRGDPAVFVESGVPVAQVFSAFLIFASIIGLLVLRKKGAA